VTADRRCNQRRGDLHLLASVAELPWPQELPPASPDHTQKAMNPGIISFAQSGCFASFFKTATSHGEAAAMSKPPSQLISASAATNISPIA
jgi:hypothetical protein